MPWYRRWRNVFREERLDRELASEFEYHIAETVDRLMAGGMSEKEAWREARRRLGNYSIQVERTRDMDIAGWLDSTRADFVYGVRQLRANPGFTVVAVLSLALGLGANTAMFQLVNAVRMKTIPVQNPEELVTVNFERGSARAGWWSTRSANFTSAQWDQLREQTKAFTGMFAWSAARFNLTTGGEPRFADGLYVSGDFFRVLGVNAAIGRTLTTADDNLSSCQAGAVLSHSFWQREFGGAVDILNRKVSLNGYPVPVIGVTPEAFTGIEVGNRYDLAIPICTDPLMAEDGKGRIPVPHGWWLSIMGRLKPGWTVASTTAHLRALSPGVMRATLPPEYKPDLVKRFLANKLEAQAAGTGVSGLRRQYENSLFILLGITGLVLLITCANLANLLLARATVREAEIAVRMAIGASRWRLVRQLLAESLLLAVAGASLGAGLAVMLCRSLVAFISTPQNPVVMDLSVDWRVMGFLAALAVSTCMMFGLLPALRATYLSPSSAMRANGRSVTAGRERFSLRRTLVATQVALSLVLLVGALLFVRSLHNLMTTDPGFRPEGVMAVHIDFSKAPYPKERRLLIYKELTERLGSLEGVQSVAQVGMTPVGGSGWDNRVGPDQSPAAGSKYESLFNRAGPGYFSTMGTRLLAGREFNERDTLTSQKVAIVTEKFAKEIFGGANPVGRTFHLEAPAGKPEKLMLVVGMVADVKYYALREDFRPVAFFPIAQDETPNPNANFMVRIAGSPGAVMNRAKGVVSAMSPSIGIEFRPFSAQLEQSLLRERLVATLSGGFGFLAGTLATLGLYGVIAYMVARRRGEIGVRIALGAGRGSIVGLVLKEALLLLGIGLVLGTALSLASSKLVTSLLYGLTANDAASIALAAAVLTITALAASYVPARRAAGLDPIATLRNE